MPAGEAVHQQRCRDAAEDEKQSGNRRRRGDDRADRQGRQQDIEREHFAHHA